MQDNISKTPSTSSLGGFSSEYQKLHVRPWSRYFAKIFDIFIASILFFTFSFFILISSSYIADVIFFKYSSLYVLFVVLFNFIFIIFSCLLDAFFLNVFGFTIGKALFNIQVRDLNGNKLKFFSAFKRNLAVWYFGLALNIPLVNIFANCRAYDKLILTSTTKWDGGKFVVTHGDISLVKYFLILVMLILIFKLKMFAYRHMDYCFFMIGVNASNQDLPEEFSDGISIDKVNVDNHAVNLHLRLVNISLNELKIDEKNDLIINIKSKLSPESMCEGLSSYFKHVPKVNFNFFDKINQPITTQAFEKNDCVKFMDASLPNKITAL